MRKTTVVREAIQKLIPALWGKPRIASVMYGLLVEVQVLENAIWDGIEARLIDTATGLYLRKLGEIVGQPNLGAPPWGDPLYRLYIKARIRANRANGKITDLLDVASVVSTVLRYWDGPDASFELRLDTPYPADVRRMVTLAASAGVDVRVQFGGTWAWGTSSATFSHASAPDTTGGLLQDTVIVT